MNDLNWERSRSLKPVDLTALTEALQEYRAGSVARALKPVSIGCRNSNYVLQTESETLFLRLTDSPPNAERAAFGRLHKTLYMPELLFEGEMSDSHFLLYAYVAGISLQHHINTAGCCSPEIAAQAGAAAARLHASGTDFPASTAAFTPPPFETWYELFLQNETAQAVLGAPLVARVRSMLTRETASVRAIAALPTVPIHADFRPTNMLIDASGRICIVDWESFGPGHALGDVGQFFRFRKQFAPAAMRAFETAYNAISAFPLPEGWQRLALLRDLVNPLQMLGRSWNAPHAKADLTALVRGTLEMLEA